MSAVSKSDAEISQSLSKKSLGRRFNWQYVWHGVGVKQQEVTFLTYRTEASYFLCAAASLISSTWFPSKYYGDLLLKCPKGAGR